MVDNNVILNSILMRLKNIEDSCKVIKENQTRNMETIIAIGEVVDAIYDSLERDGDNDFIDDQKEKTPEPIEDEPEAEESDDESEEVDEPKSQSK